LHASYKNTLPSFFFIYVVLVILLASLFSSFSLLQQGDPIEQRYKEWTERKPAVDQLMYCINSFREAALSKDPKFEHIDIEEKQKVS
jgi:hypothetical protein